MFSMKYLLILGLSLLTFAQEDLKVNKVFEFSINSTINPATYRYLSKGLKKVPENSMALIKLNTPGGLVSTTKDILNLFGEAKFPIIVWITPEGSSATSAGALISAGADYLFMSDGTNIGAATPIASTGKNIDGSDKKSSDDAGSDLRAKAINDLVALTTSLCEKYGRNKNAFKLMISEAKSYSAQQAKKENVINQIVNSKKDLVKELKLSDPEFIEMPRSMIDTLLDIIANPQLAYIFFLLGAALIYFEMQAPGGFIAGALGAGCLLLAGIGFQVLPINFAAAGLVLLSLILFILESYITSYGILFIGGLLSLVFGSLLLFDTPDSLLILDRRVIFVTIATLLGIFGFIAYIFFKESDAPSSDHFNIPKDKKGSVFKVLDLIGPSIYQIKVQGQFWKAKSKDKLEPGDKIIVIDRDPTDQESLILEIKKI